MFHTEKEGVRIFIILLSREIAALTNMPRALSLARESKFFYLMVLEYTTAAYKLTSRKYFAWA